MDAGASLRREILAFEGNVQRSREVKERYKFEKKKDKKNSEG